MNLLKPHGSQASATLPEIEQKLRLAFFRLGPESREFLRIVARLFPETERLLGRRQHRRR
jgi:hypothetical protein